MRHQKSSLPQEDQLGTWEYPVIAEPPEAVSEMLKSPQHVPCRTVFWPHDSPCQALPAIGRLGLVMMMMKGVCGSWSRPTYTCPRRTLSTSGLKGPPTLLQPGPSSSLKLCQPPKERQGCRDTGFQTIKVFWELNGITELIWNRKFYGMLGCVPPQNWSTRLEVPSLTGTPQGLSYPGSETDTGLADQHKGQQGKTRQGLLTPSRWITRQVYTTMPEHILESGHKSAGVTRANVQKRPQKGCVIKKLE